MAEPISDPALLSQLEAGASRVPVSDPNLIKSLETNVENPGYGETAADVGKQAVHGFYGGLNAAYYLPNRAVNFAWQKMGGKEPVFGEGPRLEGLPAAAVNKAAEAAG